ncbi:MAG: class I SAM-dependent methyltransferase [Defluviitaleaceae bacterium]|nr:class I SAM-dependent methyltransferase [Defluviitaleaceae bacterium]MCL2262287.1 class I SAM-dependent methyltransferase [Defluviitaleaceae bacterium]
MIVTSITQKIESLASEAGPFYRLAEKYYIDMVEKESALAGIGEDDHILCVGGGCCPFSAILFHRITKAKVTVIDNNADCIPKARKVIARLGLSEHIRVVFQDGCPPDIRDYSVIHLALQVFPMEKVIAEVERRMSPGTKMLVRRPKKQLCCMYSKISNATLAACSYITHKSRNVGSTFLYKF